MVVRRHQIAWYLWAIGSVLIVLSWFNIVSTGIGWIGFAIGMVGSVLGWGLRPPSRSAERSEGGDPDPKT